MKSNEVRTRFLSYFHDRGHEIVPSSSLVPQADPTLLFTNAGMVQFKDYFLGEAKPEYNRAVTSQKCVRAGGKHNDLETVGKTPRHHTLFEMMGNFSFGDYFKQQAIQYAWELLTDVYKLPTDRLWASVHEHDHEAEQLWLKTTPLPEDRIVRLGDKDNYWSMGDVGPCGPCSEIIFDRGVKYKCDRRDCMIGVCDCDRWLELWNLVFMQYDRKADGEKVELPHPSIDTGMGLERISSVLQGVDSNYETDLFTGIIDKLVQITGRSDNGMASRVIADHVRCCSFLITDGVRPGNEGRNYVLRRILRRAVRYGKDLGQTGPFLFELVPEVIKTMGSAYPELKQNGEQVAGIIRGEEQRFHETLGEGTKKAEEILSKADGMVSGRDAFLLYDTYGFPLDLVRDMAEMRGMKVDEDGFNDEMEKQRARARQSGGADDVAVAIRSMRSDSEFVGQDGSDLTVDTTMVDVREVEGGFAVCLEQTPFYAEGGGQIGDTGIIRGDGFEAEVKDTKAVGNGIVHLVSVREGRPEVGLKVTAIVDRHRRQRIAVHHTTTHLLHYVLRQVLGDHVVQSGSLVEPERLRFDYSHYDAVTKSQLDEIEDRVNELIRSDLEVAAEVMGRKEAEQSGAVALFGERYGDEVRVVSCGNSRELCGGTHVGRTGMVGMFLITSDSSIGSGLRRIEAVAGKACHDYVRNMQQVLNHSCELLKCSPDEVGRRIGELQDERKQWQREVEQLQRKLGRSALDELIDGAVDVKGVKVVSGVVPGVDVDTLRSLIDSIRDRLECCVAVLGTDSDDRALLVAGATSVAVDQGVHCGKLIGRLAKLVGGGGGGKPQMAQAGGKKPEQLAVALEQTDGFVAEQLG